MFENHSKNLILQNCERSDYFRTTLIWLTKTMMDWLHFCLLADMVNKMLSSLKITIKVSFYNITSEASYVYFRFFLNKMNINLIDKDNDGWTHFCFAYGYGQQDVVKQFLNYQISILMRLFWKFLNTVLSRVTSKVALAI